MIEPRHLPPEINASSLAVDGLPAVPGASILDFERYAIMKTLEATGSTRKTAALLGISVRKIQYRLQQYRLQQLEGAGSSWQQTEASKSGLRRTAFRGAR
jgi:DNA-binding NtrC family response regulator